MKNLLVIGFVWPEPNTTAAGSRMLQLLDFFLDQNYTISFASAASKTKNSYDLTKLNIQTFNITLNNSTFNELLKKINPTVVLFDRFLTEEQFGWRVAEVCPKSLRILDTEDLHFLREARRIGYKTNKPVSLKLLTNQLAKREIASIYRCDISLIISKFEIKLLKKTFNVPKQLLCYLPFLLNKVTKKVLLSYPDFKNRSNFMTIGNFLHKPNLNAVQLLKKEIWPVIRKKLPKSQLHIYGAYATQQIQQLHNKKEGFIVKSYVENTSSIFINYKVCLAPLQFGAGLKGKLLDAMLYGTPSVTTSVGAEAMHKNLPWNGFITDNLEMFALKAVELYSDENSWKLAQLNGIEILNSCYSKKKFYKKLFIKINSTQANLEVHRITNFTGEMLMHHTLKSTKYLSKWIEEKNKKES